MIIVKLVTLFLYANIIILGAPLSAFLAVCIKSVSMTLRFSMISFIIIFAKKTMKEKKYDLEERLIDFAVEIISYIDQLRTTKASSHLGSQLLRSGTAPALNYGEAKGAESKGDFIHKMRICLKELRESQNCLKILFKAKLDKSEQSSLVLLNECNELIAIFIKSINTANKSIK